MFTLEILVGIGYALYLGIGMWVVLSLSANQTLRMVWEKNTPMPYEQACVIAGLTWIVSWIAIYLWWRKMR